MTAGQMSGRRGGRKHSAETKRKIGDANRGHKVALGPDELLISDAAREYGVGELALWRATKPGPNGEPARVRSHRRPWRPGRPEAVVLRRAELQKDLATCICDDPECDAIALGPSGYCRRHFRKAAYARLRAERASELAEMGMVTPATLPGLVSDVYPALSSATVLHWISAGLLPGMRTGLLPDAQIAAFRKMDLAIDKAAAVAFVRSWVAGGDWRRRNWRRADWRGRWYQKRFKSQKMFGWLAVLIAAADGKQPGPPTLERQEPELAARILELLRTGRRARAVARIVTAEIASGHLTPRDAERREISRDHVRGIIARADKVGDNPPLLA